MNKSKTNEVVKEEELVSNTIGALDNKPKKPTVLIIMIIIFIVVAIFLPNITSLIDSFLHPENNQQINIPQSKKEEKEVIPEEKEEETPYLEYSSELVITDELFTISNFAINDNVLTMNINNIKDEELNLNDYKHYLELYNDEGTLLQRIKISYGKIGASSSNTYQFNLDDSNFTKLLLVTKNLEDFPDVVIPEGSSIYSLSCNKGNNTISFNFLNKELMTIDNTISYKNTDADYIFNYNNYKNNAQNISTEGISYKFVDIENGFNYTTTLDLNKLNETTIKIGNYDANFKLKTLLKEVKFDIESSGYSCQQ